MEHIFSPNSSGDLRSDTHQSQIIGGNADVDHTQIIGRIHSIYWGRYIPQFPPPTPPGFGTPDTERVAAKAPSRRLTCLKFDWRCAL